MRALDRALAYFNVLGESAYAAMDVINSMRMTPPPVSISSIRTKGRKFASQKSRANRRKAGRRP